MSAFLRRLLLYVNTTRYLRVSQLVWFIYRRLRPVVNTTPVNAEPVHGALAPVAFARGVQPEQRELRFLNVSKPADPANTDWHPADMSRLWRYNLHYFDYLQWESIPAGDKALYISDWIASNPMGTEDAWEPYTLSLRVVNWIKFFSQQQDEVPAEWQHSLINQAKWLSKNLERHILANHYLKNAKALVFAGAYFSGHEGKAFLKLGLEIFSQEIKEQFLQDGGHYERSPMYHNISLEDCLDVYNVLHAHDALSGQPAVRTALETVRDVAERGLRFLDDILAGDGRIYLFNDAAHGIAPDPETLLEYGQRLIGYERAPRPPVPVRICKPQTGFYGYRYGSDSLLIDCGPVGPAYQSGHTHCDTLSYELCRNGQRLVVDSGVYGYAEDPTRNILRGTAAHNTVMVAGTEQSEIWGTFRVARRAEPGEVTLSEFAGDRIEFSGSHKGYRRLPGRITHSRRFDVQAESGLSIEDRLSGAGATDAQSFIHFHPSVALASEADNEWLVSVDGQSVARLIVASQCEVTLDDADYCPEFGIRQTGPVVRLAVSGDLPLQISYELAWVDYGPLQAPAAN